MIEPSWRKPAGILGILAMVTLWAIIVASASRWIGSLSWPLQAILYAFAGTIWIAPLRPVLQWMETGRWRE